MKLIEALKISQSPLPDSLRQLRLFLLCGFTPLHLQTFLTAHLRCRMPDHAPEISTGLFGDLVGNIERLKSSEADVLAVALEWTDLDPRLGIRRLGGWRPEQLSDIALSAESAAQRIRRALEAASRDTTTILSLPTLPLPPAFATRPLQSASQELQLHRIVAQLGESLAGCPGIRMLSSQRLAEISAPGVRYDIKSDLLSGFPYTPGHASAMAELMACMVENRPPLKGLITDLDDTLWSGIVGEDGVDGISWNLDDHSQMHGVYQQFLSSLAASGVLIGVASKNDAGIVSQAFERPDLVLSKEDVFPFEVHWASKTESVRRILNTWNIAADAAVFIDDSPAEVAEVHAAFPELTCRRFPRDDTAAIWTLLHGLRDLFGKRIVTQEDSLRLRSIRDAAAWRDEKGASQTPSDDFLRSAEARISFEYGRSVADVRAFELVNKTNQFNLNGERYTEAEWREFLADPSAFLLTATYEDKYGALGKVAVLMGSIYTGHVQLRTWVMSCRAFSRRIEYQSLRYLFDELGAELISFQYAPTPRNGPLHDFLTSLASAPLDASVTLSKEDFSTRAPQLFHRVEVSVDA
jgi:FkbH-like protein